MSTSIAGTDTSDPTKYYCFDGTSTYDGYANIDSSDPRTDTQCQDKSCGSLGWEKSNKADGTACTDSGKASTCVSGACKVVSPQVPICSATLSVSTGTGDPCNVVASVSGDCKNKNFEVREGAAVKCAGITDGSGAGNCGSAFTQSAVAHDYDLYVSESGFPVKKDAKTGVRCGITGACVDPSGWNTKGGCESDGCKWCSFLTPSCVFPGTYCPAGGGFDCPARASESTCNSQSGRCGWCADSYSGRTTANGGQCMNANDLAAQCDSCYNAERYELLRRYAKCSDRCASDALSYGYVGGWCIAGQGSDGGWYPSLCDSTDNRCRCEGNEFASAKSNDRIVNCGECALSSETLFGVTVSRDCGGTAVRSEPEGKIAQSQMLTINSPGVLRNSNIDYTWTIIPGYLDIISDPLLYFGLTSNTAGSQGHFDKIDIYVDNELFATMPEWQGYDYAPSPASKQLPKRYLIDGQVNVKAYIYYSADNRGIVYFQPRIGSYSYYSAPAECSGGLDEDRDCLVDCDDSDCYANAACAGIPAKKSCNAAGNPYGPCGSCAGVKYNGASTTCQYGVCQPPKCSDIIDQHGSTIRAYDSNNDGKISQSEAENAVIDFFGGRITAAQATALNDFYAQDCSVSAECRPQNPSVTISPASQSGSSGQTLTYAVSITNNDNLACEPLSFSLTKTCPLGWTCDLSRMVTSPITPGETDASTALAVTSASGAGVGQYDLSVTAASGAYRGTNFAKYNIGCAPNDPVVSLSPQSASGLPGDTVTSIVTVTNRNCGAETCALSATSTGSGFPSLTPSTLSLSSGASGTSTLSYALPAAGTGSITVKAICGAREGKDIFGWTSGGGAASCRSIFYGDVCTPYGYLTRVTCNCNIYNCL